MARFTSKAPKADRKAARKQKRGARRERWGQIRQAWVLTRQRDSKMVPIVLGSVALVLVVAVVIGLLLGHLIPLIIIGLFLSAAVGMAVFGRRAQSAAFGTVEGQTGAAVAVIQSMRGMWLVTPVVAATRNQDVLHRVVGRPGIVLVGEGNRNRLGPLVGQEKKRVGRVAGDVPLYDLIVGNAAGEVPLRKLQSHLNKLPRNMKAAEARGIDGRLKVLGAARPPIPQGPLPRTARMSRGGKVR